jgi:hypothetical protein
MNTGEDIDQEDKWEAVFGWDNLYLHQLYVFLFARLLVDNFFFE